MVKCLCANCGRGFSRAIICVFRGFDIQNHRHYIISVIIKDINFKQGQGNHCQKRNLYNMGRLHSRYFWLSYAAFFFTFAEYLLKFQQQQKSIEQLLLFPQCFKRLALGLVWERVNPFPPNDTF